MVRAPPAAFADVVRQHFLIQVRSATDRAPPLSEASRQRPRVLAQLEQWCADSSPANAHKFRRVISELTTALDALTQH